MDAKVSEFDVTIEQKDGYVFEARFDKPQHAPLVLDEPPPLGKDTAPNATRILAAAIGNCLSASLVFCAKRHAKLELNGVRTEVHVEIVRNENRRLRVGKVEVTIHPPEGVDPVAFAACREMFEDFCTVTQSVRQGIEVDLKVEPG